MAILEIFKRKVENVNGHFRDKTFMTLICDQCKKTYEISRNLKIARENPRHYCGHECHRVAMKSGGIADISRKKTCREKYGIDYLISRNDVAKAASLKGNSPEGRKKAAKSFRKHLDEYSFQLTRGLTLTRSKSEVDFLTSLGAELDVTLHYQKYKNGWWIDAYCEEYDCWIQFDGVYWHSRPGHQERDRNQDAWFESQGMRLLRITDKEALEPEAVKRFANLVRNQNAF